MPDRTLRVLIVDNDPDTANSLGALARIWGHEVCVSYGGAAALDIALTFRPDVMLLDIGMPGVDGNRVAQEVRRRSGPQMLLVAVTAHAGQEERDAARLAGFDRYLVKPADPDEVKAILAEVARD